MFDEEMMDEGPEVSWPDDGVDVETPEVEDSQDFEHLSPAPEVRKHELVLSIEEGDIYKTKNIHLAEIIKRTNSFAVSEAGDLHYFKDGKYVDGGEKAVRQAVQVLEVKFNRDIKRSRVEEVVSILKNESESLLSIPSKYKLNVTNGLLVIGTSGDVYNFGSHDPKYLTTVQLACNYDPNATCGAWDKLVEDVWPKGENGEDLTGLFWELVAWLMLPIISVKKSFLFHGAGNDGKSIMLNAIMAFLGKQNVSNLSIYDLGERFQNVALVGKLANIDGDLPVRQLSSDAISELKKITGGDSIRIEPKGARSFIYQPFCRFVYACNELPKKEDTTKALESRFIIIPFEKSFEEDAKLKAKLEAELSDPRELAGALNKALEALPRVLSEPFAGYALLKSKVNTITKNEDPFARWLDECTKEEDGAVTFLYELMDAYRKLESGDKARNSSAIVFGKALAKYRPRVTRKLEKDGSGKYATACIGIAIRDEILVDGEGAEFEGVEM